MRARFGGRPPDCPAPPTAVRHASVDGQDFAVRPAAPRRAANDFELRAADGSLVARALQSREPGSAAIACAVSRERFDDIYSYAFRTASADGANVCALVADGESARRIVARAAAPSAPPTPEPASCSTRFSGWAFGPGPASSVSAARTC